MRTCVRVSGKCLHSTEDCSSCRFSVDEDIADEIVALRASNAKLLKKLEAATAALGTVPPVIRDAIMACDVEACIRYGQAVDANVVLMREDLELARRMGRRAEALEAIVKEVRVSNGLTMTTDPGYVGRCTTLGPRQPLGEWLRDQRLPFVKQRDDARRERDDALKERDAALALVECLRRESTLEKAAQLLDSRGFRAAACVVRVMDKKVRAKVQEKVRG